MIIRNDFFISKLIKALDEMRLDVYLDKNEENNI